jgi:hypothetical protein
VRCSGCGDLKSTLASNPVYVNLGVCHTVEVSTAAVAVVAGEGPDMSQVQALRMQQEVQLRFLCPSDVEEVKKLCIDWFPIE